MCAKTRTYLRMEEKVGEGSSEGIPEENVEGKTGVFLERMKGTV